MNIKMNSKMKKISRIGLLVATILMVMVIALSRCVQSNAAVSSTGDFANAVLSLVTPYNGTPYCTINGNVPLFTANDLSVKPFEYYSELDSLGRCGSAYANICKELMPTEPRGEIGMVKPSGWQTVKYNGYVEGNYLYNRCHLIGYQLAGENANVKNLITGTRYMNANGMLPFENYIANYIYSNPNNHVLYRVTPIYAGNNLVATGVLMEAYSVEDSGAGVKFCVFCYNVQPGFAIDYANGNSALVDPAKCVTSSTQSATANQQVTTNTTTTNQQVTSNTVTPQGVYYIGNARNGKLHLSTCKSLPAAKNQRKFATKSEAVAAGYSDPCGNCKP